MNTKADINSLEVEKGKKIREIFKERRRGKRRIFAITFFILLLFNIALEISLFIYLCKLVHLSFKSPFKNHIIGDLSYYFNDVEESPAKINNKFIENDNVFTKNYINKKSKSFLRHLVSKALCLEIRNNFIEFKGSKLSEIFDFNLDRVNLFSVINLVISSLLFLFVLIWLFITIIALYEENKIDSNKNNDYSKDKLNKNIILVKLFIYSYDLFNILIKIFTNARFILTLVLYYYISNSDLNKYDDFLDCQNVKKGFFDRFSYANGFRKNFYLYLILDISIQGIEKLNQSFGYDFFKFYDSLLTFVEKDYKKESDSDKSSSNIISIPP